MTIPTLRHLQVTTVVHKISSEAVNSTQHCDPITQISSHPASQPQPHPTVRLLSLLSTTAICLEKKTLYSLQPVLFILLISYYVYIDTFNTF